MLKVQNIILIMFALLSFSSVTFSSSLNEDYDGDGVNDKTIQEVINDSSIKFTIWISSLNNKKQSYVINSITGSAEPPNIYADNNVKGILIVDNSSMSRIGGELLLDVYKWFPNKSNWILIKRVGGVKADMVLDLSPPDMTVDHVKCCHVLGDSSDIETFSESEVNSELNNELEKISQQIQKKNIDGVLLEVDQYKAAEYAKLLNDRNLILLNDLAFYLEKKDPMASAIILEKIVNKYPNRVVAKLNLADAYWAILEGNSPKIKQLYQQYKEAMIQKGLAKKIPARVFERTK